MRKLPLIAVMSVLTCLTTNAAEKRPLCSPSLNPAELAEIAVVAEFGSASHRYELHPRIWGSGGVSPKFDEDALRRETVQLRDVAEAAMLKRLEIAAGADAPWLNGTPFNWTITSESLRASSVAAERRFNEAPAALSLLDQFERGIRDCIYWIEGENTARQAIRTLQVLPAIDRNKKMAACATKSLLFYLGYDNLDSLPDGVLVSKRQTKTKEPFYEISDAAVFLMNLPFFSKRIGLVPGTTRNDIKQQLESYLNRECVK